MSASGFDLAFEDFRIGCALDLQDPALAERFLRGAIARVPSSAAAHEQLGIALAQQSRTTEAIVMLERATQLAPQDASARFVLAMAYLQHNQPSEAHAQLVAVIQIDPDYPDAAHWLAQLDGFR